MLEFVPASEIDPMMYDRSYFLEPEGKSTKSYVLLAKTLMETNRVAIVHFALAQQDAACGVACPGLQQAGRHGHPDPAEAG